MNKILRHDKVLVKQTMTEEAIGQWLRPKGYQLAYVTVRIPVFKINLNVLHGSFEEFKRFILHEFNEKLPHPGANAYALSFDYEGTHWNFINIQDMEFTAEHYGTLAHELHHFAHFSLKNMGVSYGDAGEEVYSYLQGHAMELVLRAFVMLRKAEKKKK